MPRPWQVVGRIHQGANPFVATTTAKQIWCPQCNDEVDFETDVGDADGVKVFRRRCTRCGKVLMHGIDSTALQSNQALPPSAVAFIRQRGEDRR